MVKYDPTQAPDPEEWLALPESARIESVRKYHQSHREKAPDATAHAAMHAIVENQLAEGLPQAQRALERLLGGGLNRHDAIHAIAAALADHIWNLTNKPQGPGDPNAPYLAALDKLTPEAWRRSG